MFFNVFNRKTKEKQLAEQLYKDIVKQARNKAFYTSYGVPDTMEGRYEMIVIHIFLFLQNLENSEKNNAQIGKAISEEFFSELDGSLREMGVGDITVPKKMRKLADSFYGRLYAYKEGIEKNEKNTLSQAIQRNVFGHDDENKELGTTSLNSDKLSNYMIETNKLLSNNIKEALSLGTIKFQPL